MGIFLFLKNRKIQSRGANSAIALCLSSSWCNCPEQPASCITRGAISCSGLSPPVRIAAAPMSILAVLVKGTEAGAAAVLFPSIACSVLEIGR